MSRRASNARLRESFPELVRSQSQEALGLLRDAQSDPDVLDAVRAILERIREQAIALDQGTVATTASRAIRALGSTVSVTAVEELISCCDGKISIAPVLRPIAVLVPADHAHHLKKQAQNLASAVRIVSDVPTLLRVARAERLGGAWLPSEELHGLEDPRPAELGGVPLYVYDDDDNLPSRLLAARLGAVGFLHAPFSLREAVRQVREDASRMSAAPWRVVLVDRADAAADGLAGALGSEDLHVRPLRGGFRLLEALDEHVPDLVIVGTQLEGVSTQDIFAVLRAHNRFASVPVMVLADAGEAVRFSPACDGILRRSEPHASLRRQVVEMAERTSRIRALREIDAVTGLLTETALLRAADQAVANARRNPVPVTAVRLELADALALRRERGAGHVERVVRTVAAQLRERLRAVDAIGRVGPAGFAMVMSRCSARRASTRVTEVQAGVSAIPDLGPVGLVSGITDTSAGKEEILLRAEELVGRARATGVPSLIG